MIQVTVPPRGPLDTATDTIRLVFHKMPTHEELIEWGLGLAKQKFEDDGGFNAALICIKEVSGFGYAVMLDLNDAMANIETREAVWQGYRDMIAATATDMIMLMAETWVATLPGGGERDVLPRDLATYDLANEGVMFQVETKDARTYRQFETVREKGKPRLGREKHAGGTIDDAKSNAACLLYRPTLPGLPN